MADAAVIPQVRSCAYNIPLALDTTLLETRGPEPHLAKNRNANLLGDCKASIFGPMPVQKFMDHFLPPAIAGDKSDMLESLDAFKSVPLRGAEASDIYIPLVAAINARSGPKSRCPGFVFEVAATRSSHPKRPGYMKPHICCYTPENAEIVNGSDPSSRVEFGYAELFIDIQPDPALDFFVDPPSQPAARARHDFLQSACDEDDMPIVNLVVTLGQHIAYAAETLARQPRTFLFTVALSGSRARFLLWDRAGGVATEAFDLRDRPELLCEFLWRFSRATSAERGHDMSVQPATEEEEELFRDVIQRHARSQLDKDNDDALKCAVAEHYKPGHVYAIDVVHQRPQSGESTRRFIVSRPLVSSLSLIGRGTRGYWAADTTNRSIVFVKDTWRFRALRELEAETLQHLNGLGVRYVPSVVWYGDVHDSFDVAHEPHETSYKKFQDTLSHQVMSQDWVCRFNEQKPFAARRRHHRLVMGTVGHSLNRLRGTEELLHSTYDVFTAMRETLEKDSRIHRDISVGNIILVKEEGVAVRRGYLIDWETSCTVDDAGAATQAGRVGTWQYLSIRMMSELEGQNGRPTFQDEMESLLYVVLYCALLWQEHGTSQRQLTNIITEMFDKFREPEDGIRDGGDGKLVNAQERVFTRSVRFKNRDLSEWLNTVMDFHSPPPHLQAEYKDKWAHPEQLDAYWLKFLQTHKLDSDNRADNKMDQYDIYDSITPPPLLPSPSPPACAPSPRRSETPSPPFPRRKRKIEQSEDYSSGSQPKQARTEQPASAQPDSTQPAPVHLDHMQRVPAQLDGIQRNSAQSDAVQPATVQLDAAPSPLLPNSARPASIQPAATVPSRDPPPPTPLRRSPRKHASSQPKPSATGNKSRKTRAAGASGNTRCK